MPRSCLNTYGVGFIHLFGKDSSEKEIRRDLPIVFPRLWRYALVLTSNSDLASDLAQATCLKALEKANSYQPGTQLDRWLFRMAQRIWFNDLRAQAVRRGNGLQPVEDIDIPSGAPDAETNTFASEVLSSVHSLPEAQRASVLLVYVEGFSYAEAAETLDVPIGTIMSRLSVARKTLNARLGNTAAGTP